MTYQKELNSARHLAREAGYLIMKYRDGELEVELKEQEEPVTVADRAASELIVGGLSAAFPDDVVISEENADDLRRLDAERVWYVDPIDGTRDFIKGRDGFAVMIGLTVSHAPVIGVVYAPVSDRMFWADTGHAWLEFPGCEEPRQIAASSVNRMSDIRLVASRSNRSGTIDAVKSALGITEEYNVGSVGLKLALIALGERDLYVNPSSRCKSWDTCAPEALLRAAGGALTDVHGDPLRYDLQDLGRRSGLVASNGLVHEAVIEHMRPLFAASRPTGNSPDRPGELT
ncbi:MAG: 3'(2'),5'-bisphosphate nucleotidase CysQ [Proteobacteria bacterium]|nr:3'(2'),5'-bisphosphate nucleotidase CysQ [Pseudomonadota bacterium]